MAYFQRASTPPRVAGFKRLQIRQASTGRPVAGHKAGSGKLIPSTGRPVAGHKAGSGKLIAESSRWAGRPERDTDIRR
jgi:hypothetical protein